MSKLMNTGTEKSRMKKRHPKAYNTKNSKKTKPVRETDPLALYFKQISKFPLLSVHDEQAIV